MRWPQRQLTVVVLAVVALLPAAAAVCSAFCSAPQRSVQNGSHCHRAEDRSGAAVAARADADCGSHGLSIRDVPATAPDVRPHAGDMTRDGAPDDIDPISLTCLSGEAALGRHAPPGCALPVVPLILRV
jgi:hypothetical protein